jgi:hypothetical protein
MTMFDGRTNLSAQVVAEVREHFSDRIYNTVIPRTVRLSEAPSFGKSIFEHDPHGPGAALIARSPRNSSSGTLRPKPTNAARPLRKRWFGIREDRFFLHDPAVFSATRLEAMLSG